MTYDELIDRAKRAVGLKPDADAGLLDCVHALHQYSLGHSRGVIGEGLAREMAEYIEQHKTVPAAARVKAVH